MTLDEVIKELTELREGMLYGNMTNKAEACRFGIEALKLNLVMRDSYHAPELLELPGETKKKTKA